VEKKTLYRYNREGGGVTISTEKPDVEHTELFRLVADEGMILTDGNTTAVCVDTENVAVWAETEAPSMYYFYGEAVDPAELNRQYVETDEPVEKMEV
jgi:hypothetical protein